MSSSWKSFFKKNGECSNPGAEIEINNKKWKSKRVEISYVNVSSSVGPEASTCSVELTLFDSLNYDKKGNIKLDSDFADVKIGAKVEVKLGYKSISIKNLKSSIDAETVFKGYISSIDLEITTNKVVKMTIQGMDAKMWMMINKKTELKKDKKKYSAIVKDVYSGYSSKFEGNKVKISDEASFEREIYQRNESDFEFLSRISNLTGSLFFVDREGKFHFISPSVQKGSKLKVEPYGGVKHVKLSASIWGIPKSVEVVGINQKDYKGLIEGKATSSEKIGKGKEATNLTSNISMNSKIRIVDNTIRSTKEAKFLAESIYNQRDLGLAEVNLKLAGYPEAELSTGIKLKGFDDPIDNDYIITSIEHNYSLSPKQYTTSLKLKTNRLTPKEKIF